MSGLNYLQKTLTSLLLETVSYTHLDVYKRQLLESLPYEEPVEEAPEEMEVSGEDNVSEDIQTELDDDGQITLSLE